MADMTNDLLTAILAATPDRKVLALRVLRGEEGGEGERKNAVPERFVTMSHLARMLGVSTCSLWRWRVPGHALGGRRRFRVSEVTAYLDSTEFRAVAEELKSKRRAVQDEARHMPTRGAVIAKRKRVRPCAQSGSESGYPCSRTGTGEGGKEAGVS